MDKILKISQQTLWQIVVKITTAVSGFIILGIVSRKYGESGTGDFTLGLTYLAFFYILSDASFNAHLMGRLQEKGSQLEWRKLLGVRILWSLFLITFSVVIVIFLPFNPPSFGFSPTFKLAVILGSITILFYGLNITAHSIFQAKLKYQLDAIPTFLGVSLGTILIWRLSSFETPVYLMVLGYVLAWFIHSSGTILAAKRFIKTLSPVFDLVYLKRLFMEVWPLGSTLVLNVIYFRADAFILSYFKSSAEVGIYNLAYQVFQAVLVIPTFIMNSFYPMMLETLKIKINGFSYQIKLAALGLLLISLLISLVLFALSPVIVSAISGGGFFRSVDALRILSIGLPAYFLSSLALWVMVAKKYYKEMLWVYGLGLIFNLLTNLIFIPKYSYIAASYITGISEYLILIFQMVILWRLLKK